MKRAIDQYCARVSRNLRCLPQTRKDILAGLKEELEYLPEAACESLQTLEQRYGTVAHTAQELQDSVPLTEQRLVSARRKRACVAAILALVLTAAVTTSLAVRADRELNQLVEVSPGVYIELPEGLDEIGTGKLDDQGMEGELVSRTFEELSRETLFCCVYEIWEETP